MRNTNFKHRIFLAALVTLTMTIALFSAGSQANVVDPATIKIQKKIYTPTGEEGTITGLTLFTGEAPARVDIDMTVDPVCAKLNLDPIKEDTIVNDGRLANVFVYVKSGSVLDSFNFETPPSPIILERKGCQYVPRLLGIQVRQPLQVINADPTVHNINVQPKLNPAWNRSQPPKVEPIVQQFDHPETFIPLKDNQHPWEKGWIGVFAHPFFAVSGQEGSYRIDGLPPGDYTIVAWHEMFGEQEVKITVRPKEWIPLNFTFANSKAP